MSGDVPDPRTLESWEDAFKYPVVTVRGMEKKLRRDIDENHEKLRTLVGASYRDLLDTARTIIDVNGQMEKVETLLVDIGRRSDSRILDKIAANYTKLEKAARAQDAKQLALASQLSVLQKCLNIVARLLKYHGSTLLAAKLLVIARLLHKTTSTAPEAPPICKTLGTRLASLRQRLLRHIDRRLAKRTEDSASLVEDMTAFSLATSSTPSDVLKHFQHLRSDAICRTLLEDKESVRDSILRRIQLFLSTLRDSRAIYPDVFAASLRALGARPLVEDSSVTSIDELSLDIHQRWFASDVKNYMPYTRHDELNRTKAEELFGLWSSQTSVVLTDRIRQDVAVEDDLRSVVEVRRDTLQLWLSSKRDARELDWNRVFNNLRTPFLQQIKHLVDTASDELQNSVCKSIMSQVQSWDTKPAQPSTGLWDIQYLTSDLGDGAFSFRNAIVQQRSGRNESINELLHVYGTSTNTLEQVSTNIKAMKDTRWEDDYGSLDDDDEDDTISMSQVLSKTDPEELQNILHRKLVDTVESIQSILTEQIKGQHLDSSSASAPGLFIIRALRELRQHIPQLLRHVESVTSQRPFCQDLVVKLQTSLAAAVVEKTEPAFEVQLGKFIKSKYQVQSLWVGSPALPIQPTPATFGYLRAVVKQMESLGQDLWYPDAVNSLKEAQVEMLAGLLKRIGEQLQEQAADAMKPMEHAEVENIEVQLNGASHVEDGDNVQSTAGAKTEVSTNDESVQPESQPASLSEQPDSVQPTAEQSSDEPTSTEPSIAETTPTSPTVPETENPPSSAPDPAPEPHQPTSDTKPPTQPPSHLQTQAKATQLFFDALYLSEAFSLVDKDATPRSTSTIPIPATSAASLSEVVGILMEGAGVDAVGEARVRRSAREYWRRTFALFGLLVGG